MVWFLAKWCGFTLLETGSSSHVWEEGWEGGMNTLLYRQPWRSHHLAAAMEPPEMFLLLDESHSPVGGTT